MQKGFSLVELMFVIAIIAILAAVAIPMYSNYTTRAQVASEISEIGGIKADVSERIMTANSTAIAAIAAGTGATETGNPDTLVTNAGVITKTSTAISGSNILLTPTLGSGSMTWTCTVTNNPADSSLPSTCTAVA